MHPAASLVLENAYTYRKLLVPLLFSVFALVANVDEPVQHSLLIKAVSWAVLWVLAVTKAGIWSNTREKRRTTSWLAGSLLALAQICDRAACDKEGTWATKSLLPLLVVLISHNDLLPKLAALPIHGAHDDAAKEPPTLSDTHSHISFSRLPLISTASAGVVLAVYAVPATSALGTCSVIFAATGLVLLERVVRATEDDDTSAARPNTPISGTPSSEGFTKASQLAALRDVAAVVATLCGLASWWLEPSTSHAISWQPLYRQYSRDWKTVNDFMILQRTLWMIPVNISTNALMYIITSQHGAEHSSYLTLFAIICAKLSLVPSITSIWFTILFVSSAFLYTRGTSSSTSFLEQRDFVRVLRKVIFGLWALSTVLLGLQYASEAHGRRISPDDLSIITTLPPQSPFEQAPTDLTKGHPASQLVNAAESEFHNVLSRQSTSLAEAVQEYRRRHGIAPPPQFDKWYEFAIRNKVVMIDEYDMINDMLLPFWALKPASIRSRITRELGGEDSALVGVAIRNGEIVNIEKGDEWQQQATAGMMANFVKYLPDMDLGFNIHDEPRVVVPGNLLSAMVDEAKHTILPRAAKNQSPRNEFSKRPEGMNDGKRFVETYVSKFNRFAHQQTWTPSRLSCPADSQAQTFEDFAPDNLTAYAAGPLEYVYNTTAFSDICISPSLSSTFGFFERPNAFNIIHELTPVFSQSKISSFQDILYPSPWYWMGKVTYDSTHDTIWENKTNALYWRGSTTGGFSRNGGWRRQHRQHIVQRINAPDKAQVLLPSPDSTTHTLTTIDRRSLKHLIDVHFSHIGQCDPGDCDAQQEFFHLTERADAQDAWFFKHLLDMDGNAFSGRFYSFLKSRSLTYKMAVFREWHAEWLRPWVHYVPLSLRGEEHLDLVRWFSGEAAGGEGTKGADGKVAGKGGNGDSEGEKKARQIAERSTEWHDKVLRNVDFEAWFFRLMLEYGRVVDDRREEIGYGGP